MSIKGILGYLRTHSLFGEEVMVSYTKDELWRKFASEEGDMSMIYGRPRNGKTYFATVLAIEYANRGVPVYVSWPIKYDGKDERDSLFLLMVSTLLPVAPRFYNYHPELIVHYVMTDEWAITQGYRTFFEWFKSRTDCVFMTDEAHKFVSSYDGTKVGDEKRDTFLETGHFGRRIFLVTQRPTAVHVLARGNCARFWKVKRVWRWPLIMVAQKFEDMVGETVDETANSRTGWRVLVGRKSIMRAYDTRYLRYGKSPSQYPMVDVWRLPLKARFIRLYRRFERLAGMLRVGSKEEGKVSEGTASALGHRLDIPVTQGTDGEHKER